MGTVWEAFLGLDLGISYRNRLLCPSHLFRIRKVNCGKAYQANRKIENVTLNKNIHKNLTKMIGKIKDRLEKWDQETKNFIGKKMCKTCLRTYAVEFLFLNNIT